MVDRIKEYLLVKTKEIGFIQDVNFQRGENDFRLIRKNENCIDYIIYNVSKLKSKSQYIYAVRKTFPILEDYFDCDALKEVIHLQEERYSVTLGHGSIEITEEQFGDECKSTLNEIVGHVKNSFSTYDWVNDMISLNKLVNTPFNKLEYLWMPPKWLYKIKIADLANDLETRDNIWEYTYCYYKELLNGDDNNLKAKQTITFLKDMKSAFLT